MSEVIISAKDISKQFHRKRADSNVFDAVSRLDLDVEEGKLIVILGHSGSGKSTLLNMIAGMLEPTSGQVTILGEDLYHMDDKTLSLFRNRHIGVIPQGQSAISSLNVYENIKLQYTMCSKNNGASEDDIEKRIVELMDEMGITELASVMPSELSGGELRRMAIARALVNDPEIILADEPTSDLDDDNTEIVIKLLRGFANKGKAVIVVTHDKDVVDHADAHYKMSDSVLSKQ